MGALATRPTDRPREHGIEWEEGPLALVRAGMIGPPQLFSIIHVGVARGGNALVPVTVEAVESGGPTAVAALRVHQVDGSAHQQRDDERYKCGATTGHARKLHAEHR
ncbi:MAG: hypothetical protein IPO90_16225 [Flavobacteriales bacterium]|nr:hypothetical protein [Flavobacteriales bacterium]